MVESSVGKISVYNGLFPGRLRFPYAESPNSYSSWYNVPIIEDFDAMFAAHIISAGPKPADEFRVLLLGNSATWGGHVSPENMLAEQFNRLGMNACDGRKIKVYDFGYPWPSLLRDLLVLDRAMEYEPDMVIWLVTLHSFEKKAADRDFLIPHAERMAEVIDEYDLKLPKAYSREPGFTFWDKTIVGQRERLKNYFCSRFTDPYGRQPGLITITDCRRRMLSFHRMWQPEFHILIICLLSSPRRLSIH